MPGWDALGRPALVDERGQPLEDVQARFLDVRPKTDDRGRPINPEGAIPDVSGTYRVSLLGYADLSSVEPGASVEEHRYDRETNRTTATVYLSPGVGVLYLRFSNTHRSLGSSTGGFEDLSVYRPGYEPPDAVGQGASAAPDGPRSGGDLHQATSSDAPVRAFTREIRSALTAVPFHVIRFDRFAGAGDSALAFPQRRPWSLRKHPEAIGTAPSVPGGDRGVAWEYAIALSNLTRTGMWINVPVDASDSYVTALAQLVAETLDDSLPVYVEVGHEVWNPIRAGYVYNRAAARAASEGHAAGPTVSPDDDTAAIRRHLVRTVEVGAGFRDAFSEAGRHPEDVRVIFAWDVRSPTQIDQALRWCSERFGDPKRLLYGVAIDASFGEAQTEPGAREDDLANAIAGGLTSSVATRRHLIDVAGRWGIEPLAYAAGSRNVPAVGFDPAVRACVEESPVMGEILASSLTSHWWSLGGGLAVLGALSSPPGGLGHTGLLTDVGNLEWGHKLSAVRRVVSETR